MRTAAAALLVVAVASALVGANPALAGPTAVPASLAGTTSASAGSWTAGIAAAESWMALRMLPFAPGAHTATLPALGPGEVLQVGFVDGAFVARAVPALPAAPFVPTGQDVDGLASPEVCLTSNDIGSPVPANPIKPNCKGSTGSNVGIPHGLFVSGTFLVYGTQETFTWLNYTVTGSQIMLHCTYAPGALQVGVTLLQGTVSCDPYGVTGTFALGDVWKMEGRITSGFNGLVVHTAY